MTKNPCLSCGACCAFYRASFYWAEADDATFGGVPVELTRRMDDFRRAMLGHSGENPRCIALVGQIGEAVHCAIHARRASVCRDFQPSWLAGVGNERCDRARLAWGLAPLTPDWWQDNFPKAA
ncbi:YkgJ family cysteine cluster protein [Thiovibrio sp. JS02]